MKKLFANKYFMYAIVAIVTAIVVYMLITWWKRKDETTVKIVDDNGNSVSVNQADIQKASALAERLFNTIDGLTFTQDWEAYQLLAEESNTIFALTLAAYKDKYGRSLIADIQGEFGYSAYWEIIINRAQNLNLS